MNKAASSSSSALPNLIKYDVFVSFRGQDTRRSIISHLYAGLTRNGIETFRDDESLEKGGEIGPALFNAIQSSNISIIMFSQSYASSRWCLNELIQTLQCREIDRQIVIPVFYEIDPSDVRKQRGHYADAFAKIEEEFRDSMDEVQKRRAALKVAASLCGWVSRSVGSDSKLVENIIQDILDKRIPSNLNISIYPLRYDVCHEYLSVFFQEGSDDVLVVGIVGEAKMGKTMIAKAICDRYFRSFNGNSFLVDVGQKSKEPNGMVELQKKLLFDLLGEMIEIIHVQGGLNVIKERLCHKRVLIILDDVDDLSQLFALVGDKKWFGKGSKIIITSRDLPLLRIFGVDQMFMVQGLPLPLNIQEIWDPYQQSCSKISGLTEYIQRFSYMTIETVTYLEECLIRERRQGAIQAQIIHELQHDQGEGLASNSCTTLEEVGTTSKPKSENGRIESSSSSQGNNKGIDNSLKIHTPGSVSCTSSSDLKVPSCILTPDKDRITLDASCKVTYEVEQLKGEVGLAVGTLGNTVAVGIIVNLDGPDFQIHGTPLGDENMCVVVVVPIQENVRLPVPVQGDLETVGDAVGCYVAWPKNLVQLPMRTGLKQKMYEEDMVSHFASLSVMQSKEMKQKQPKRDESQVEMPGQLRVVVRFAQQALKDGQTIRVSMPADIVGYEHTLIVLEEDIVQFGELQEISATCIAIYLKYLYNMVVSLNLRHKFSFLDPCRMASLRGNNQDESARYLADELKRAHSGQLFFLPYNTGAHWVLLIIDPSSCCVYFFDSVQQPINDEMKNVVDRGLQMCGLNQILPIWKEVQCPQQLTSKECGFYVMRYMKEIIDERMHAINLKFNGKSSYTIEEINEIRAEWGNFMQAYIKLVSRH